MSRLKRIAEQEQVNKELIEFILDNMVVDGDSEFDEGEPKVMYTRNGDGYPGSPAGGNVWFSGKLSLSQIQARFPEVTDEELEGLAAWMTENWDDDADVQEFVHNMFDDLKPEQVDNMGTDNSVNFSFSGGEFKVDARFDNVELI